MAITLISSTSIGTANLNNPVTTAAIDTTGVDFIIAWTSGYLPNAPITDSYGNTYTQISMFSSVAVGFRAWINYCAAPITGAAHTFTAGIYYNSIMVAAFSGVDPTGFPTAMNNFDNTTPGGATIQSGAITPVIGGVAIATLASYDYPSVFSIDSGFSIIEQVSPANSVHCGGAIAWLTASSTTPVNPTWTISVPGSTTGNGAQIVLLLAAGPVTPPNVTVAEMDSISLLDRISVPGPKLAADLIVLSDSVGLSGLPLNLIRPGDFIYLTDLAGFDLSVYPPGSQRGNIDYDQIRRSARSGDGSKFHTLIGSITTGNTVKFDSAGNLIDAGVAPGGGGGGTGWIGLSFNNSWTNYGSGPNGEFRIDEDGRVWLRGIIVPGTTTVGTTVATLPSGFRPTISRYFYITVESSSGFPGGLLGIQSNGAIVFMNLDGGGTITKISLECVSFATT